MRIEPEGTPALRSRRDEADLEGAAGSPAATGSLGQEDQLLGVPDRVSKLARGTKVVAHLEGEGRTIALAPLISRPIHARVVHQDGGAAGPELRVVGGRSRR